MRTLGIKIIDDSAGKHVCMDVKVLALVEQEDGSVEEVDISTAVRGVYPRLKVGEAATATLDVFLTGYEGRCDVEEILVKHLPKRRKWARARRLFDISTLGSGGVKEFARR